MEKLRWQTINSWNAYRQGKEVIITFNSYHSAIKFMQWLNQEGKIYVGSRKDNKA